MTERTTRSAVARIEEIIRRLDSGDAGLRETLDLVKEGRELVSTALPSSTPSAAGWRSCGSRSSSRGWRPVPFASSDHVRPVRRPAAARSTGTARGAQAEVSSRLRAAITVVHLRAPATRGSARTSSTKPRTTSRCSRPGRFRRSPAVHARRVLRVDRLARPVPRGAQARRLTAVPPLDVPQRRARPRLAPGREVAARGAGARAPAGHVRRLAAPWRAADARPDRRTGWRTTRRCASSSTRRARGRRS